MIVITATLVAKPGEEDALAACCKAVIAPTKTEEGCIEYDCGQSLVDPRTFQFVEIWESMDNLKAHTMTEHMAVFSPLAESLSESQVIDAHFIEKTRRLRPRPES
jgi:quinol monooxygenase YgiN